MSVPTDPWRSRIALAAVLALWAGVASAESRMGELDGDVSIGRGEPAAWQAARSGDPLAPGDRIRTGAGAHAEVLLGSATVRLYENSLLRLPSSGAADAKGQRSLHLEQGRSLFDVVKRKLGLAPFEVETPQVVVSVKGTRFEVALGRDLAEVSVFHGVVGLREPRANELVETLVREGFAARGGVGQPFELEVSMEGDPWERWREAAPARIESHSRPLERDALRLESAEAALAAARRSSDVQVLDHAARRHPEVAERLERLAREKRSLRPDADELRDGGRPVRFEEPPADVDMPPAAPAPGELLETPDPMDLMKDMGMMEEPGDDGRAEPPDDGDLPCSDDCAPPSPSGQYEALQELLQLGYGMNEIQHVVELAIADIGAEQLEDLYRNDGDWETPLFDYLTTQGQLDDEVAKLLIELMETYAAGR